MDFGLLSNKQSVTETTDAKRDGSWLLDEDGLRLSNKMPKLDLSTKKCGEGFGRSNVAWPPLSEDGENQKMLCFAASSEQQPPHPQYCGYDSSSRSIAFSIPQDDHRLGSSPFSRIRGPFTPSQRMELENQAWIYKHLVANVPVPPHLLLPLKRSPPPPLYLYGSHGSYPSNLFGWGIPYHLGYSGSNDPEPGRCRRTDGKKWRCSREAVEDQKYCERHINRGRHRSRKPVEARQSNDHRQVIASRSLVSSNVGGESNGLGVLEPQAPSIGLKPKDISFEESSEFGLVSSDSLLGPSQRTSYAPTTNPNPYWQEGLKYDWTQLSMSIPDFSSQEKSSTISAAQHEPAPVHAGLALFEQIHENDDGSWLPLMGGPLGEVLTSTTTTSTSGGYMSGSSPTGVLQKSMMLGGGSISNSSSGS